ncbi:MAG: metallophosphoesterase [Dehalococcoidia bacterium]
MIEEVRWLHLSDLHLRTDGDPYSQDTVLEALQKDLTLRLEKFGTLHFALITGDLAFSGRSAEYDRVRTFLQDLSSSTGLSPEMMFLVPGNHDVDRNKARYQYDGVRTRVLTQPDVDRFLGESDELRHLLSRQDAFWSLDAGLNGGARREFSDSGLGYCANLDIDGFVLAVAAFNTAWLSGSEDGEARLVVGERHFQEVLKLADAYDPQLILGIGHHPPEWLTEWDRASCEQGMLPRIDIYHRGHEHRATVGLAAKPRSPCLMVAAGATHAGRHYSNSYNLIRLRLGDGECEIESLTYDPVSNSFASGPSDTADIRLRGFIPCTPSELAAAMEASCPELKPYVNYGAALLTGQVSDIPVDTARGTLFAAPGAARAAGTVAPEIEGMLRLARLIPAYRSEVTVEERLDENREVLDGFAGLMTRLSEGRDFLEAVRLRNSECGRLLGTESAIHRPHAKALLTDLLEEGDCEAILEMSERHLESPDPILCRMATHAVVGCLMKDVEPDQLRRAKKLAGGLTQRVDTTWEDWVILAGVFGAMGDDERALDVLERAIDRWPHEVALLNAAQVAAAAMGNREFLDRLNMQEGSGA